MLLNFLQCKRQPLTAKNFQVPNFQAVVLRLRTSIWENQHVGRLPAPGGLVLNAAQK